MQMLLPVWLNLRLWAISITGYRACSSFEKLRTFPSCRFPLRAHACARYPNKAPPQTLSILLSCNSPKQETLSAISWKVIRTQHRPIHLTSYIASAILIYCWNPCLKPSACLWRVERERRAESGVQNVGCPRGRRLLPQERPVLNKSFNFHAQLPYLPLIQCGSE